MKRKWNASEITILREHYPNVRAADIARVLDRPIRSVYKKAHALGLRKSAAFLASERSGRVQRGKQDARMRATQFRAGHVPYNKGLRRPGWAPGRMAETQFKKGQMSGAAQRNYVPIGTERISKDGTLERKITDDPALYPARRWTAVHRLVWQAAHGAVPSGHIVVFKPGMRTAVAREITLDKIELISRAENIRRNSYHTRYPKDVARLIQLRGALNRQINRRSTAA